MWRIWIRIRVQTDLYLFGGADFGRAFALTISGCKVGVGSVHRVSLGLTWGLISGFVWLFFLNKYFYQASSKSVADKQLYHDFLHLYVP